MYFYESIFGMKMFGNGSKRERMGPLKASSIIISGRILIKGLQNFMSRVSTRLDSVSSLCSGKGRLRLRRKRLMRLMVMRQEMMSVRRCTVHVHFVPLGV